MFNLKQRVAVQQPVPIKGVVALFSFVILVMLFLFMSYAYLYAYSLGGPAPVYYYVFFICISSFLLAASPAFGYTLSIPNCKAVVFFYFWLLLYISYMGMHYIFFSQSEFALETLINALEIVLLAGVAAYMLIALNLVRAFMVVMAVAAILAVFLNILDFFWPYFSNVPGRAAGLYVNSNISGKMLCFLMVAGVLVVPKKLQFFFVLICGIGVFFTFSRSAWFLWLIGFTWFLLRNQWRLSFRMIYKSIFGITISLVMGFTLYSGVLGSFIENSWIEPYLTSNTIQRLGISAAVISGESADVREALAYTSLQEWSEKPVFGHGASYTTTWESGLRSHNMYLTFLVEGGLIGFFVYMALLVGLWLSAVGPGRTLVVLIAVSGMFTHNNLEQVSVIMMLAFVLSHAVHIKKYQNKQVPK